MFWASLFASSSLQLILRHFLLVEDSFPHLGVFSIELFELEFGFLVDVFEFDGKELFCVGGCEIDGTDAIGVDGQVLQNSVGVSPVS